MKDGDIIIDQPGAFARHVKTTFGVIPSVPLKRNKAMFIDRPVRVPAPRPFDVLDAPECDADPDPTIPQG